MKQIYELCRHLQTLTEEMQVYKTIKFFRGLQNNIATFYRCLLIKCIKQMLTKTTKL